MVGPVFMVIETYCPGWGGGVGTIEEEQLHSSGAL
jgi:hypothetical protein